jgi:hypothetical protein
MKLLKILINESRYKEVSQKYRPYIDAEIEASIVSEGSNLNMLTLLLNNDFMNNTKQKYLNFLLKSWYSPKSEWDKISDLNIPGNERNLVNTIKRMNRDGKNKNDFVEQAILILEFFDKNKSKFTYTDINKYGVIWDLYPEYVELKEVAEKKQAEKDFEKLYEDERVLIGIPKTHEASCVYGARTKWCISGKDDFEWRRHTKEGLLYFIIFKKVNPNSHFAKVAVHVKHDGPGDIFASDWWDAVDDRMTNKSKEALRLAIPEEGLNAIIEFQKKFNPKNFMDIIYESIISEEKTQGPIGMNVVTATDNHMVNFDWDLESLEKLQTEKNAMIYTAVNYRFKIEDRYTESGVSNDKPIYKEIGRCFLTFYVSKDLSLDNTFSSDFMFERDPDEINTIPSHTFISVKNNNFSFKHFLNDHIRLIFRKDIDGILERGLKNQGYQEDDTREN